MEKNNDSVIVKIVSVAGVLAALAIMLILLLHGGLFTDIVADINSTKEGYETATIYDICYYNAVNVVYAVVYAVALFSTLLAPVALMLRFNGAALLAKCAVIADVVLAFVVLAAKLLAGNGLIHKVAAKIYLKETGVVDTYGDYLGVLPVIGAVVMLVLAVVAWILIVMGKLDKIKLYNNEGPREIVRMIIPVLYGVLFMQTIRPVIIMTVCEKVGGITFTVNTLVQDYYFSGKGAWGFDIPYVWFVIIIAAAVVVANRYFKSLKNKVMPVLLGIVSALYVIRCVVYLMNPLRLFGYLTLDENICDVTEAAYPVYMILLVTDVLLIMLLAHWCTKKELAKRTLLIILGCHCVISCIAILLASVSVAVVYGICLVANIFGLVGIFYMAYVRGRHH